MIWKKNCGFDCRDAALIRPSQEANDRSALNFWLENGTGQKSIENKNKSLAIQKYPIMECFYDQLLNDNAIFNNNT